MGYLEDHVHDVSIRKWNLIELQFSPTIRLATGDFDVVALSNTWLARLSTNGRPCGVSLISMQGGTLSSGTIQIPDADDVIFTILRATNGGQGVGVNIWEAWFGAANESAVPDATQLRAAGKINSSLKDNSAGTDLVTINLVGQGRGANVYVPPRLVAALTKV